MRVTTILAVAFVVVVSSLGCRPSKVTLASGVEKDAVKQGPDDRPKEAIVSILRGGGHSAILEIEGRCIDARAVSYALKLNASAIEGKGPLERLRASLLGNPGLTVAQDKEGIIVISDDRIDLGFLQTRMQRLELSEVEQYNPNDALLAVLGSDEVRTYMNQHGISLAPELNGLRASASPELPHLAARFDGLTVEQFARKILEVFPGIMIYQECSSPGRHKLVSLEADRIAVKPTR